MATSRATAQGESVTLNDVLGCDEDGEAMLCFGSTYVFAYTFKIYKNKEASQRQDIVLNTLDGVCMIRSKKLRKSMLLAVQRNVANSVNSHSKN